MTAPVSQTRTVRALAQRFDLNENLVEVALADTVRHAQPWYVMALAGAGTWVGAFLIALALFTLDVLDGDAARFVTGLAALVAGACASRLDRGVVATQVAMIGTVAGQLLFLSGLNHGSLTILVGLLLQLVVIAAVDRPLTKGLAGLAFFGFALAFLDEHDLPADAFPLAAALAACAAWLGERRLLPVPVLGTSLRAVGVASALALCGFLLFEAIAMSTGVTHSPFRLASPAGLAIGLGVITSGALVVIARRRPGFHRGTAAVAAAAIGVGVLLSLDAPGLVAALLVIVLGVGARARLLVGLGLAFLFAFLALTYYRLDVTLTAKALWAIATGSLVLVVRAFVLPRPLTGTHASDGLAAKVRARVTSSAFLRERKAARTVLVATVCALGVPGALVVHKERVIASGERVLLPLAPRDPRSLLQGDYMELRTVVAVDALAALRGRDDSDDSDGDGDDDREHEPRSGSVVVRVDSDRVATFVRVDDGTPLVPGELRLRFRLRGNTWSTHVRIGAESLFFEEGRGDHYARARFGEVVVDGDGDTVLIGVRDEGKQQL